MNDLHLLYHVATQDHLYGYASSAVAKAQCRFLSRVCSGSSIRQSINRDAPDSHAVSPKSMAEVDELIHPANSVSRGLIPRQTGLSYRRTSCFPCEDNHRAQDLAVVILRTERWCAGKLLIASAAGSEGELMPACEREVAIGSSHSRMRRGWQFQQPVKL